MCQRDSTSGGALGWLPRLATLVRRTSSRSAPLASGGPVGLMSPSVLMLTAKPLRPRETQCSSGAGFDVLVACLPRGDVRPTETLVELAGVLAADIAGHAQHTTTTGLGAHQGEPLAWGRVGVSVHTTTIVNRIHCVKQQGFQWRVGATAPASAPGWLARPTSAGVPYFGPTPYRLPRCGA